MNLRTLILGSLLSLTLAGPAFALTMEEDVTPEYVRTHPEEFSLEVKKTKEGLLAFTLRHDVPQPMYHIAHLEIYLRGKLVASSETPVFGRKHANTFHFMVAPEYLNEARFSLSDGGLAEADGETLPIPGSNIRHFRLKDFVPQELRGAATVK
jgi:hypothetical protein